MSPCRRHELPVRRCPAAQRDRPRDGARPRPRPRRRRDRRLQRLRGQLRGEHRRCHGRLPQGGRGARPLGDAPRGPPELGQHERHDPGGGAQVPGDDRARLERAREAEPGLAPAGRDPPHARGRRGHGNHGQRRARAARCGAEARGTQDARSSSPSRRARSPPAIGAAPTSRTSGRPAARRPTAGPGPAGRSLPASGSRPTVASRACPAGPGRSSCAPGSSTAPVRRVPASSRSGSSSVRSAGPSGREVVRVPAHGRPASSGGI